MGLQDVGPGDEGKGRSSPQGEWQRCSLGATQDPRYQGAVPAQPNSALLWGSGSDAVWERHKIHGTREQFQRNIIQLSSWSESEHNR